MKNLLNFIILIISISFSPKSYSQSDTDILIDWKKSEGINSHVLSIMKQIHGEKDSLHLYFTQRKNILKNDSTGDDLARLNKELKQAFSTMKNTNVKPGSPNYPYFLNHQKSSTAMDTIELLKSTLYGAIRFNNGKEITYIDDKGREKSLSFEKIKNIKLNKFNSNQEEIKFIESCYYTNGNKDSLFNKIKSYLRIYFNNYKFDYSNAINGKDHFNISYRNYKEDKVEGRLSFEVTDDILLRYAGTAIMTDGNYLVRNELKYLLEILVKNDLVEVSVSNISTWQPTFKPAELNGNIVHIPERMKSDGSTIPARKEKLSEKHYIISSAEFYNNKQCLCELDKKALKSKLKTYTDPVMKKRLNKCNRKQNNSNAEAVSVVQQNIYNLLAQLFILQES